MKNRDELARALEVGGGAVRDKDHPQLRWAIRSAVADGLASRPLPGIVMASDDSRWQSMVRATWLWRPDVVFTSTAAAALSWWPGAPVGSVAARTTRARTAPPAGLTPLMTRPLPPELTSSHGHTWLAIPAASALDAADHGEMDTLFHGLRTGAFAPADLRVTAELARLESWRKTATRVRNNPWSVAELDFHDLLRGAGISRWKGNAPVEIGGRFYIGDLVFDNVKVVVEVDSWTHHGSRAAIEHDWERHNAFESDGYRVLHFPPSRIRRDPRAVLNELCALLTSHNFRQDRQVSNFRSLPGTGLLSGGDFGGRGVVPRPRRLWPGPQDGLARPA